MRRIRWYYGTLVGMFPLRDENPSHHFPLVTVALILINCTVFGYEVSLGPAADAFVQSFAFIPSDFWYSHSVYPLFTSMFLHGGIGHVFGNMWFLWIFGDNLEDHLGKFHYLVFYTVTGLAAGLVHGWLNPESPVPTVGASGAISGILGGYMVLHPRIKIKTVVTLGFFWNIIYLPAIFFLALWFLMQLLGGLGGPSQVAFGAHIGGFVAGTVLIFLLTKRGGNRPSRRYDPWRQRRF